MVLGSLVPIIAERLSVRQLIPRRISEIVCMYVCMYVSVTLKNARMSHLGMQFYTTLPKAISGETEISREC